jgi:hypothetical protein
MDLNNVMCATGCFSIIWKLPKKSYYPLYMELSMVNSKTLFWVSEPAGWGQEMKDSSRWSLYLKVAW